MVDFLEYLLITWFYIGPQRFPIAMCLHAISIEFYLNFKTYGLRSSQLPAIRYALVIYIVGIFALGNLLYCTCFKTPSPKTCQEALDGTIRITTNQTNVYTYVHQQPYVVGSDSSDLSVANA